MIARKLYKKRKFRHLLLAICALQWTFEKNADTHKLKVYQI